MVSNANQIVQKAVDTAIDQGGEVGVQVAAYLDGELAVDVHGGVADDTTGREVDGDTVFPVFSVIKAVTATALHIQAERGLVDYYTPVAHYWPEFGKHGKDKGTLYDALTHRIGVPLMPVAVTPELMCDWDWMVGQMADMHPLFEPGTKSGYMAYTFGWVVGEVVRRTDPKERPFGVFIQDEICQPLGIDSLWAGIPADVDPRVARLIDMPPDRPGMAAKVFQDLAAENIAVRLIIQSASSDDRGRITFILDAELADRAARLVDRWKTEGITSDGVLEREVAKISIVGSRLTSTPGLAARMFTVLAREGINIDCISSSEMKIACVIAADDLDRAVRVVHDEFFASTGQPVSGEVTG